MTTLLNGEAPLWLARLGWSLLHFVWQGAVVGLLYAMVRPLLRFASAQGRYLAALAFLLVLGACPLVTFWFLGSGPGASAGSPAGMAMSVVVPAGPQLQSVSTDGIVGPAVAWLALLAPWIVPAWAAGVLLLSGRLFVDWYRVRAVVAAAEPVAEDPWLGVIERVAHAVGLSRPVRLLESFAIEVPVVVGWLRPVVLVPTSVLVGLDPRQLELILVHELAHVRRGDHLVNLLQVAIETLLFYHPVVRWISSDVRHEREHCCDDLVVRTHGDRLAYARALVELEGLRGLAATAAVSSAGGNLSLRIRRIVGMPAPQQGAADWLVGATLMALGATTLGLGSFEQTSDEPAAEAIASGAAPSIGRDGSRSSAPPVEVDALPAESATTAAQAVPEPETGQMPGIEPPSSSAAVVSTDSEPQPGSAPDLSLNEQSAGLRAGAMRPQPAVVPIVQPEIERPRIDPVTEVSVDLPRLPTVEPTAIAPAADDRPGPGRGPVIEPGGSAGTVTPEPVVTGGRPVRIKAPEFPADARHVGHEGYVVVEFTVDRTGRPRDIEVVDRGPRDLFGRAAVRAIREWRFEPVRVDGEPVERRMTQRFTFVLDGTTSLETDECVLLTGSRLCR
ncbi:MAG TPA: M56 family metallopeptidase [Steroidobacteraceae bacterium]|nr:M56 family metallopeptidase [Steroidobacteraceae bacterium]